MSLNSARVQLGFVVLAPLCIGLVSMCLGADSNFDLHNYHLYDAYALLGDRRGLDLAPAGMQSYFNPLLDLPYYYMSRHWPPRLVGFVMGLVQGLDVVLLLGIARATLSGLPPSDKYRLPLYLTLAGCLTANFMTGIGNTMGDAITAIFPLGALLILLTRWDVLLAWSRRAVPVLLLAGLVAGLGVGLKLTNAIYALALCLGFLFVSVPWPARLRLAFIFGVGALAGFAVTGGFWVAAMWRDYGNPLYPQFSAIFPNALTSSVAAVDTHYLPHGWAQALLWPFVITLDPLRVSELPVAQVIWAVLYALVLLWAAWALHGRLRSKQQPTMDSRRLYLLVYLILGFMLWMKLFSIYRYLVAIEMLAPLAAFVLMTHVLEYGRGKRVAAWVLGITACIALLGSTSSWGHAGWADPLYQVDVPPMAGPASTTVLTTLEPDAEPYAWLAAFFPKDVAFVGVGMDFPESPAYRGRVHEIVKRRGGPVYVIVPAYRGPAADSLRLRYYRELVIAGINHWAPQLGLAESKPGCLPLKRLSGRLHTHADVHETPLAGGEVRCELAPAAEGPEVTAAKDRDFVARYGAVLKRYDLKLDAASCVIYSARIGQGLNPYQWCRVSDTSTPAR